MQINQISEKKEKKLSEILKQLLFRLEPVPLARWMLVPNRDLHFCETGLNGLGGCHPSAVALQILSRRRKEKV